jgi:cell cycle sensor histidine kinase DivJ
MLTLADALAVLTRLQSAAPTPTADKIGDVAELLRTLDTENAYLSALTRDQIVSIPADDAPAAHTDDLLAWLDMALRPTLGIIREQVDALQSSALGRITTEQSDTLSVIGRQADFGFALLNALRQVVALREGTLRLYPAALDVRELLREAHDRMYRRAEQRDHRIAVQYPGSYVKAKADYDHTLAILVELLDNAIRYTPVGGAIQLSAEDTGGLVLFNVADNGIGIAANDLEHVGKAFWRALHQPLVRQHPGTGLHIYLAREILALQGGEIIFTGEPGVGSTFSFTLPAAHTP